MHLVLQVLVFSCAAFFSLFVLSKLLGKKQIAQLTFVDYIIGISIGSIAAEMAAQTEKPFYHYLVAMAVFFGLDLIISFIERKTPFLKRVLKGRPIVLIYEGKLIYENLKKSKLDVNDLLMLLRDKDYFDVAQIAYALFETNGAISVVPIGAERKAAVKDLPIPIEQASLPNYIIIDGEISHSGLSEINKDEKWLLSKLKIKSKKQLKSIILASYDSKNKDIITHYKR